MHVGLGHVLAAVHQRPLTESLSGNNGTRATAAQETEVTQERQRPTAATTTTHASANQSHIHT